MRKLLERYLEAERLFQETTKSFEGELNEDLRKGAVEIAEGELRVAREQLAEGVREAGLPSEDAAPPLTHQHLYANKAAMQRWLQERADQRQRAQVHRWGKHGETLRASPMREGSIGFVELGAPRSNPMEGM